MTNKHIIRRRPKFQKRTYDRGPRRNNNIRTSPIRLIDENGDNLGVVETPKALRMAYEKGLDLIEIAPTAKPPVCRIMSYGKYQYQQAKQDKQKRAHQKKTEIKGIRIGMKTGKHDIETKVKQVEKFLKQGHKVKIDVMLRGREKALIDVAKEKLDDFLKIISIPIKIDQEIKRQPRGLTTIISNEESNE
ncbi:MAG: translation initiation factor IF-3 [bacterium]